MTQLANILRNREAPYALKVSESAEKIIKNVILKHNTTLVSIVFKEYVIAQVESGATIDEITYTVGAYDWNNAYTEYTKNIQCIEIADNPEYIHMIQFFKDNGLNVELTYSPKLTLTLKYI